MCEAMGVVFVCRYLHMDVYKKVMFVCMCMSMYVCMYFCVSTHLCMDGRMDVNVYRLIYLDQKMQEESRKRTCVYPDQDCGVTKTPCHTTKLLLSVENHRFWECLNNNGYIHTSSHVKTTSFNRNTNHLGTPRLMATHI